MTASFSSLPDAPTVNSEIPRNTGEKVSVSCQGVLFDMDGILISSLGSVERSWKTWALARGLDVSHAIHTAHGRRAIETIRMLRPDLDDATELKLIEDLEVEDKEGLTVLPGVLDLLAALPPDRWTVVTSATERLARVRMAAGGVPIPSRMVTADTVAQGKPDPAPYLAGAEILGLDPGACVVFEDSASGVKSGRAAGCTVIGTTFSHSIPELAAAHYLITDLTQISVQFLPGTGTITFDFLPLPR
jgi:mannitol-1-/sugar-/sorbitol-6-phosphatase